ncbi:LPS export ABC transporter permease LptG [Deltaproteobacteria bacterium]|nr:LPS export ABC transporter permease LptG [Deltaproteobacteria bacterium]
MKVLTKYISREFIGLFILCQFIFLSLFLVIDFVQKIDNFMEAGVSQGTIFSFFFFKTPYVMVQMMPVATMISVIIVLSIMKKNNELVAMKACGLDTLRLSQSIVIIALLISIVSFLLSELIVPYASSKSNEIWDIEVNKQDPARFYGSNQIWYKSSNAIYWIKHFDGAGKIMQNPTFYFFDNGFRLVKKIEGKKGIWEGGAWRIEEGIVQSLQEDGDYKLTKFNDLFLEIAETPDTFIRKIKEPEDMSYQQLKRYAETVGEEGYDNAGYLVDLNIKLAFPLISFVLALVGIPVALRLKTGGMPLAISIGIGLCFLYMLIIGFSRSLGLSGTLPPLLSAWTANLAFILFGVYLMMNLER